ncbi:acyl-CoA thioesterase [Meiothermus granaticius]|uniref:Long-chain acyl-CoA thioesterase FadM n=1 Tax=Meiothermus granaticius NBRC 107808 TaxID=1227551 RepID=A0A399FB75_9DEIN|nr:acyl-CoA thioesterase [Meiothermus granaticius]RIH93393.1 Long-chain acyl-CoA thioesterase FadM [Meiothermus granaticius NBRC 107808]GEM87642.1 tol-pal system-associated acyl-CoA thioesterase [Meiothermus granaticius NBRC 107808]
MDPRTHHQHQIIVRAEDIDELEHVNNTVYLRYIEDVVVAHAARVGMGFPVLKALGVIPVVYQHVIRYHRPAVLGDRLEVSTQITAFKGFRASRHNEVRRVADHALLVECDTDWVWIDAVRGRPKAVPLAIQEAFGVMGLEAPPKT